MLPHYFPVCNALCMMAQQDIGTIPQWTRGDRMRKALHHADVSVHDMAEYLGVARNTASTWINDRIEPSTQTMRLWAIRTGVPLEWLLHGDTPSEVPQGSTYTPQYPAGDGLAQVIPMHRRTPRVEVSRHAGISFR